ncbi:IS3 family transposase, partial [Bacteroidales bacterium OttesenSCG-928-K03]|nr:IS3 family transposase [Bacteroidales bacterium OttesenSCG-928-K03]
MQYYRQERLNYPYSLNKLYESIGISKQAVHKQTQVYNRQMEMTLNIERIVNEIREDHPTIGCRDIYYKLSPIGIGRDAFERLCKESGLMVSDRKNYKRTTDSTGVIRFDNLISDLTLDRINQVWQSDITFYEIDKRFYYLTFIVDSYSRMILGYSVSNRLYTEQTTLPALQMALNNRKDDDLSSLIFHSDGGGQYYAKQFLSITYKYGIRNSMCEYAWENGKAERINGVIKNNYLKHRQIKNFEDLKQEVDRCVKLYNNEKPHIGLKRLTPKEFENKVVNKT